MGKKNPIIDDYIAKAAPFAKPILKKLRKVVHAGCPKVEETMKWGHPAFDHKGPLAGMAAFKAHCTFGFWKHALVEKKLGKIPLGDQKAWGTFGRIADVKQLPSESRMVQYVKFAAELNDQGIKVARKKPPANRTVDVPDDLTTALIRDKKAVANFDAFSYSHKKEYVDWINQAKTPETRKRRLETAVEWIALGKGRNWKYMGKK